MQNSKELISIIIPAYNHGTYIVECINSFLEQTYQNLELIILNDGSNDNTHEKIEECRWRCEKRFNNFIYINKMNEGVTKTLNRGIELAKGKFILTLASDDKVFRKDAVEVLFTHFLREEKLEPKLAVICGDMAIIDDAGKRVYWTNHRKIEYIANPRYNFETTTSFFTHWRKEFDGFDYLGKKFGSYPSLLIGHYMPNGCLIKREAIIEVGGYCETVCIEDWDMWIKLSKKHTFKFIPEILFACRWHGTNSQITKERAIRRDIFRIVKAEQEFCRKANFEETWKTAFRLSRSGLMSNGDIIFLFRSTQRVDLKYIPGDIAFYFIHRIKRILRLVLPTKAFEKIKSLARKLLKVSH